MAEISFKPSIKVEVVILIFFFWFLPLLFALVGLIIRKKFTTYKITDNNEIIDNYEFISKSNKIYRIDQITGVTLSQNFLQKKFGLGTVSFGIFGNSSLPVANAQSGQAQVMSQQFSSILNYKQIFDELSNRIGVERSEIVFDEKPSMKPVKFFLKVWAFLSLLSIGLFSFGIWFFINHMDDFFIVAIAGISGFAFLFFIMAFVSELINVFRIRNTRYVITKNSLSLSHKYFFSNLNIKVPLSKITNTQILKNKIAFKLFGVGNVQIFTGGNRDPFFKSMDNYKKFSQIVISKYSASNGGSSVSGVEVSVGSDIVSVEVGSSGVGAVGCVSDEVPGLVTRPTKAFFVPHLIFKSIWTLILISLSFIALLFDLGIVTLILSILFGLNWLVSVVMRYLLWKNTSYEFYNHSVIIKTGVINIVTKEVYFNKLKYLSLFRGFFVERMFGGGTIILFTAGTSGAEAGISCIKEYEKIYSGLSDELLE